MNERKGEKRKEKRQNRKEKREKREKEKGERNKKNDSVETDSHSHIYRSCRWRNDVHCPRVGVVRVDGPEKNAVEQRQPWLHASYQHHINIVSGR